MKWGEIMGRIFVPGALLVMMLASNEILSLAILSILAFWFVIKIMSDRGY
jgi:hypothetical protein